MKTRKELIQKRKQIPDRQKKDFQIACGLLPFFKAGMSAGLYIPYGAEANIWQFFPEARRKKASGQEQGKQKEENTQAVWQAPVLPECCPAFRQDLSLKDLETLIASLQLHLAAPKVMGAKSMAFFEAVDLKPGSMDILEPAGAEGGQKEEIPDILIIPMLAFWNGYRKGYGKGYYDRYLAKHPECFRIGIAYDEQEERFEIQPWDERMDILVTPTRILRFADRRQKTEFPLPV